MVVDYLSYQPNRAGYQVSTKQGSGPRRHSALVMATFVDFENRFFQPPAENK